MPSIYELMKKDWKTYCLMAGIAFIEEMSKPSIHKQIKLYKHNKSEYKCFHSIQLKCKNKEIIEKWFFITKLWEKKLGVLFIGKAFSEIKKKGDQWYFNFLPNWLYYVIKTVGKFPSQHSNKIIFCRLKNWRRSQSKLKKNRYILKKETFKNLLKRKTLYNQLLNNKILAAGAFIISFDLEFRGLTVGHPDLCMSNTYKDFLIFMLNVANKWMWATCNNLVNVSVEYSRNLGINATSQSQFRISIKKLGEIYKLAGPVADKHKDKCIRFHIKRSENYINKGGQHRFKQTKQKLLDALKVLNKAKTTELQFYSDVGIDIVNYHLNDLEKKGFVKKERMGKYYLWSIKNAN